MSYGGITLEHVLAFQIRIMMGNQYGRLVKAMGDNNRDELVVACLRLGWNDAFRHVSENIPVDDKKKEELVVGICGSLCDEFIAYANQKDAEARHRLIQEWMQSDEFVQRFAAIKVTDPKQSAKALCFGHIQKMFNMAVKLYLCLKIMAEEASKPIILQYGATPDKNIELKSGLFKCEDINIVSADCPVDHYILEAIDGRMNLKKQEYGKIPWSKLSSREDAEHKDSKYIEIQDKIAFLQNDPGKWNLCFDFENWNS